MKIRILNSDKANIPAGTIIDLKKHIEANFKDGLIGIHVRSEDGELLTFWNRDDKKSFEIVNEVNGYSMTECVARMKEIIG